MPQYLDENLNANKQIIFTSNKNDQNKVSREQTDMRAMNGIDKRIFIDHKFTTTSEESFNNPSGIKPNGAYTVGQDGASAIHINIFKSTAQRIYATSSVANISARILVY